MCHPTNSPLFFVPPVEIRGGDKHLRDNDPVILRTAIANRGFAYRSCGQIKNFRQELLPLKGVILVASNMLWVRGSFQGIISDALESTVLVSPIPIFALSTPQDPLYKYLEEVSKTPFFARLITLRQVTEALPLEHHLSPLIFWAEECARSVVSA